MKRETPLIPVQTEMDVTNVIIFAAHHTVENIAALRFRGLIKYLDKKKYRVHVFSRGTCTIDKFYVESSNILVHELPGSSIGESTKNAAVLDLVFALISKPPYYWRKPVERPHGTWLINVLIEATNLCKALISKGEKCIIIGTYSPIDALICSSVLKRLLHIPCIQDFRDGFVFESLGRRGVLPHLFRRVIERHVIQDADLVTSVSPALVHDFCGRYPGKTVRLLPNGFDPADFTGGTAEDCAQARNAINTIKLNDQIIIGHFGRIGASDFSSVETLRAFVKLVSDCGFDNKYHIVFVGELTKEEVSIIGNSTIEATVIKTVKRGVALEMMKCCDFLLLLTGNRSSVATGKIFDYLASSLPIVCVSLVENAATAILYDTGAGRSVIIRNNDEDIRAFSEALSLSRNSRRQVAKYSKVCQARVLENWIEEIALSKEKLHS